MDSPVVYAVEDRDLDDAALWAVIDSAAAASMSSSSSSSFAATTTKPGTKLLSPIPFPIPSPQPKLPAQTRNHHYNYNQNSDGEVVQNHRFDKISRTSTTPRLSDASSPQPMLVNYAQPPPITPPAYISNSPKRRALDLTSYQNPNVSEVSYEKTEMSHCLATQFPTVALFKEYQNAAMAILEKSDYSIISGNTYIKKSGWRKISFYFNLSYEIKDKTIEFDENRNVQRAEFVVRAYMHGGRFSDGWGSCERREKRFMKPNHDIPCTAETRAKNRACQDLLGIGEYLPGAKKMPD